ncbi:MAG: sigma-54-dependent transcriptional regulator [Vicinamibacterales bacterium]
MAVALIVDDQRNVRRSMALLLEQDGHRVLEADGVASALQVLHSTPIDVVVSDVRLDGASTGADLLRDIKGRDEDIEVVLITAFGTIDDAVLAMRGGAYDYLTKPTDPERLRLTVLRAAERAELSREVKHLRAQMVGREEIIAVSPQMKAVLATVAQLAASDSTVLITGESGTGKELLARALYDRSARTRGRFIPINCGGMTESLLESELFGHRKGAFTGALADKRGLLEEADGGVVFLDEIGEMPQTMQVRLLRFLQEREVRPVGDTVARRVDVRLIAATHRRLDDEVRAGRFRQDFYYRINVVGVQVPPLRERVEDIAPLARVFLARMAARMRKRVNALSDDAVAVLQAYHWPGNVRELQNVIERVLNLAPGPEIQADELAVTITGPSLTPPRHDTGPATAERERLIAALEQCRWNHGRAASALGMSRTTLWRKLREHQIDI